MITLDMHTYFLYTKSPNFFYVFKLFKVEVQNHLNKNN